MAWFFQAPAHVSGASAVETIPPRAIFTVFWEAIRDIVSHPREEAQ
jgi:hypothetical protein